MSSLHSHLPYFAEGTVVSGFGRGSKQLGIPTANFPDDVIQNLPADFECGVYYGWAKVNGDENVYKMVLCVGWNPYYHNTVKTMETHIIHKFDHDFYGAHLKTIVLGYIRPMCNFESLDALIAAIHKDIADAVEHLDEPACLKYSQHPFFSQSPSAAPPERTSTEPSCCSKSGFSSNCSSAETSLSNGDIHIQLCSKHSPTQNGLLTSLQTDSTSLGKHTNYCCNCDASESQAKDNSCHSENLQEYQGPGHVKSNAIATKHSVNHGHAISINGHNEA
ncbi:hypothetical protein BsWGS_29164 [Bradybaena similaris]